MRPTAVLRVTSLAIVSIVGLAACNVHDAVPAQAGASTTAASEAGDEPSPAETDPPAPSLREDVPSETTCDPCDDTNPEPTVDDPYRAPARCDGEVLPRTQQEGEDMNPGRSCNACHAQQNAEHGADAPIFTFAGTIFANAHAPDDCRDDAAKGARIEVIDAQGRLFTAVAHASGNFFSDEAGLVPPYTAKVIFEGRERVMVKRQVDPDCNTCHSQNGDGLARGRILLP